MSQSLEVRKGGMRVLWVLGPDTRKALHTRAKAMHLAAARFDRLTWAA